MAHFFTRDYQHLGMKDRYLVGFRVLMSKNILAQLIILVDLKAWPSDPGVLMTFTRGLKSQK